MEKLTSDELNEAAMKIIMQAGDGRNMLTEAIKLTMQDGSYSEVDKKLSDAKEKIVNAHKVQTEMIQYTIEEDELQTTLLFSHAQDTLMTIYSEMKMVNYIVEMYRVLSKKMEGEK